MPHHLKKLTPNLIVADVSRSIAFYRDVLGFTLEQTVPDAEPFVFAIVKSGDVQIYLNAPGPAVEEYPALKGRPIGGTLTLFIEVADARASYDQLKDRVQVVLPLETKWYGTTEFAFLDPDGYVITFAQPAS
jgi:catechol 2,3-dioxygenase-like lactoylglutathione lyase family enzyme